MPETRPPRELIAAVYQHFAPYVRRTLWELGVRDADLPDLSHEVFLIVHAKSEHLDGIERFDLWLREICRRVAAGYRRRSVNRLELLSPDPAAIEGEVTSADTRVEDNREEAVRRALAGLDDESRDLLALHDVGELPIAELARMMLHDRKTVRKRLEVARRRLAALMQGGAGSFRPALSGTLAVSLVQSTPTRAVELTPGLQVLSVTENLVLGLQGNVAITVWPAAATSEAFDVLLDWAPPVIEACGGRFGYFAIVESTVRPPALPGRRKIVQLLDTFGGHIIQYATALLGGAAWIAQPIMSGLMVLVRPRFPMRFFTGVETASEWMTDGCAGGPDARFTAPELGSAAERLRGLAYENRSTSG